MTRALRLAAAMLAAGTGLAERPAALQVPAGQPFRVSAVAVQVDVIARDGKGRFVPDLAASEFEVFEDGQPQAIRQFYVVEGSQVRVPPGEAVAAPAAQAGLVALAPPPTSAPSRVFILFFDEEHLEPGALKRLQPAAERFLQTEFRDGDIGGVLVGDRMAGNRLTTDRNELLAAVRGVKLHAAPVLRKADLRDWPRISEPEVIRIALYDDERVLDQVVRRAEREGTGELAGGRGGGQADLRPLVMEKARFLVSQMRPMAARTLKALQGLMSGLSRIPGRKTVVFISNGFFVEEAWAELRQIVGQAAQSNVRVYSIDALGLQRRDPGTDLGSMTPLETAGGIPLETFNTIEEGPNTLAADTGGYVVRNTNDFAAAFTQIADDTSRYYVIGYSPTNAAMDGSFRRIEVRVRRPGLTVRTRRGYVASAAAPAAGGAAAASPTAVPATQPPAAAPAAPPGAAPPVGAAAGGGPPPASVAPGAAAEAGGPPSPNVPAVSLRPDSAGRVRELAALSPGADAGRSLASAGWERYGKGDLEGAAQLLGQAAVLPGAAPWVHYALGFAELGLRHADRSAEAWEHVRATVPEFKPVYLDLADAYLQQGDRGRAAEVLRRGNERWPADTELLNALGTVQVQRGSLDDAIATFRRAAEANPDDSLAFFNIARTYELRYHKYRRYVQNRWVANRDDLAQAMRFYEHYLKLGGPYAGEAQAAIERLRWMQGPAAT